MWTALDIFIGLTLCYALISLFCSAIQEFIAQAFNSRGKFLIEALKTVKLDGLTNLMQPDLVNNPGKLFGNLFDKGWGVPGKESSATEAEAAGAQVAVAQQRFDTVARAGESPDAAKALRAADKWRLPHDIPADVFARALLAKFKLIENGELAKGFKIAVEKAALPPALQARLVGLIEAKQTSVDKVIDAVGEWYDGFMRQVEHWYTRRSQAMSFLIGLAVALALNVDTFAIAQSLRDDPAKRAEAVQLAQSVSKAGGLEGCPLPATISDQTTASDYQIASAKLKECQKILEKTYPFPMGWAVRPLGIWDWFVKLCGILLSALALSLGSRFWFDTLKGLLALRTGGQPDKKGA